jgi:hypothetical protein
MREFATDTMEMEGRKFRQTILFHASSHEVTLVEMDDCNLFNEPRKE